MYAALACGTLATAAAAAAAAAPSAAKRLDARIRLYGRWDRRQEDRAVTVNGGSYIVARFDGGALAARFDLTRNKPPLPTILWQIDGDDVQPRESEIAESVELAKDLKPGGHTICLTVRGLDEHQPRWAAPLTASLTFLGFDAGTDGTILDAQPDPKLKIEFLGDSITEGVLVHGKDAPKDAWPWHTDAYRAYPSLTGLRLKDAQWRQVGFGAIGLTRGGSGGVPPAPEAFDWFYKDCPRDDWQADVVVINLGTNDGAAKGDVFRPTYAKYLALIRKAYPNAKILALRPFNGAHGDDIKSEVASRNAHDDENVSFVDTTGWLEKTDFTDGVHPNLAAGPKLAEKLAPVIQRGR
jgi:lysophospholipase L1-like esterase